MAVAPRKPPTEPGGDLIPGGGPGAAFPPPDPATAPDTTSPDTQGPSYPTGPATQPSLSAQAATLAGADTSGIPGPAQAFLQQVVTTYAGLLGWPVGVDWGQAEVDLYHAGMLTPSDAMEWLYSSRYTTDGMRKNMPWAEFGLDKDSYTQTLEKLNGAWMDLTGDQMSDEIRKRAIREGWTPTQMLDFLQYGDPNGAVAGKAPPDTSAMPWLAAGETFKSIRQQYVASTGLQKVDKDTLVSWWKFGQGTRQLGGGAPASETVFQPFSQNLRLPSSPQTEVR